MKFKCRLYRNPKDFKYGNWRYEMKTDGGIICYGKLKKKNIESKYMETYRVG